jgi:hypothetical protein
MRRNTSILSLTCRPREYDLRIETKSAGLMTSCGGRGQKSFNYSGMRYLQGYFLALLEYEAIPIIVVL